MPSERVEDFRHHIHLKAIFLDSFGAGVGSGSQRTEMWDGSQGGRAWLPGTRVAGCHGVLEHHRVHLKDHCIHRKVLNTSKTHGATLRASGSRGAPRYAVRLGTLTLAGPAGQDLSCTLGVPCTVQLAGSFVETTRALAVPRRGRRARDGV